jgi:hypothetical protein
MAVWLDFSRVTAVPSRTAASAPPMQNNAQKSRIFFIPEIQSSKFAEIV